LLGTDCKSAPSGGVNASFDKKTVQRLQDILNLDKETQQVLFRHGLQIRAIGAVCQCIY